MMNLYSYCPTIDLHGDDRDYARIRINGFIADNYKMKNSIVVIIHGNGEGILKRTTQETLKRNKYVKSYKIDNFNPGMTIVEIKQKYWQNKTFDV